MQPLERFCHMEFIKLKLSMLPHSAIASMPSDFEDSNAELRRIRFSGRLDIQGTGEIEAKFAALAACSKRRVIVDLSEVSSLASIGIRAIISNAKAQMQRGWRMVLFVGENASDAKTIDATGIYTLVPTFSALADADRAATA